MNKQMKQHLETVVNSIVNEDAEAATAAFHEYLRMKTQTILLGEGDDEECDDEADEKDDKKDDDKKDEDKDEDESKKANPFAKKDDKKDEDKDEDDEK